MKTRLLLISCSKRKHVTAHTQGMTAGELYDGVYFRIIRRWKRENPLVPLDILILSAKYGLIDWNDHILPYDLRLNEAIAQQLRPAIENKLSSLQLTNVTELYIEMGEVYLTALPNMSSYCPTAKITIGKGRIGTRLHNLRAWLDAISTCPI